MQAAKMMINTQPFQGSTTPLTPTSMMQNALNVHHIQNVTNNVNNVQNVQNVMNVQNMYGINSPNGSIQSLGSPNVVTPNKYQTLNTNNNNNPLTPNQGISVNGLNGSSL